MKYIHRLQNFLNIKIYILQGAPSILQCRGLALLPSFSLPYPNQVGTHSYLFLIDPSWVCICIYKQIWIYILSSVLFYTHYSKPWFLNLMEVFLYQNIEILCIITILFLQLCSILLDECTIIYLTSHLLMDI